MATQLAPLLVLTYTYFTVYGRIKKVRTVNAQTNLAWRVRCVSYVVKFLFFMQIVQGRYMLRRIEVFCTHNIVHNFRIQISL